MKSKRYKYLELLIIFIVIPISFVLDFSPFIKFGMGLTGFVYVLFVLLRVEKQKCMITKGIDWSLFVKNTVMKLLLIMLLTTALVWFTNKELLFSVVLNKPQLWVFILFIYSFFSVYPQELIYRTFFFNRYEALFKNSGMFIVLNAVLFALAHVLFKNALVLIITFLGGLLFAFSYTKTKSTLLVSIEHALYGCWLFTVGMGGMLGFPS